MANKIKYGLKNVHYAVYNSGTSTYGTPVAIPGAVNLSLSPVGEINSFVADDIEYFTSHGNNGYDGTVEIALVPLTFKTDCIGSVIDGNGLIFEDPTAQPEQFALLFEFTGDDKAIKHVLYNCKATRGNIDASATTNKEIKTETLNIMARPDANNRVKARTLATSDSTVVTNWYTTVHTFTA